MQVFMCDIEGITCDPGEHGFQILHTFTTLRMSHRAGVVSHDDCKANQKLDTISSHSKVADEDRVL